MIIRPIHVIFSVMLSSLV